MTTLAEVWCRACDQAATGPDALCDYHRAAAIHELGVCGFPIGRLSDPDHCSCGLAVRLDADAGWFHTYEEASL